MLKEAVEVAEVKNQATIFGYWVKDPQRYGVVEFDADGKVLTIEEKPQCPKIQLCCSRTLLLSEQGY